MEGFEKHVSSPWSRRPVATHLADIPWGGEVSLGNSRWGFILKNLVSPKNADTPCLGVSMNEGVTLQVRPLTCRNGDFTGRETKGPRSAVRHRRPHHRAAVSSETQGHCVQSFSSAGDDFRFTWGHLYLSCGTLKSSGRLCASFNLCPLQGGCWCPWWLWVSSRSGWPASSLRSASLGRLTALAFSSLLW